MEAYLLKAFACLAIFLLFYIALLEKQTMHVFKRFYLLVALGASFGIPAIVFVDYVVIGIPANILPVLTNTPILDLATNQGLGAIAKESTVDLPFLLWTLYALGFVVFAYRFLRNLTQVIFKIQKNQKLQNTFTTTVLLLDNIVPHTFFRYIFLNKNNFETKAIPQEVLLHEEAHARQKHSIDVLLIELLQVLFWFNPLIYFFKKSIKLNHEFLADEAVLKKDIPAANYQKTLLSYLSVARETHSQSPLANAINYSSYSSIKKRFKIMKTKTSNKGIVLRSFLVLPLLATLIYGFSEIEIRPVEQNPFYDSEITPSLSSDIETKEQKANALPLPKSLPITTQDSTTTKQLAEYNKLAKHYNSMSRNKMKIYKKDVERLEYLFSKMSDKQKTAAEPFPDFPVPPPSPKAPKTPNEREVAANTIQKVIEEQDPYDNVHEGIYGRIDKKPSKDLIAVPPPAPYFRETDRSLKRAEVELKEQQVLMQQKEINLKAQEIQLKKEEAKLEKQEILMTRQEEKMEEQEVIMKKMQAEMKKKEDLFAVQQNGEQFYVPNPPTPPIPITPLDHVIGMAKKDAQFLYEGKGISSDKAIELIKNNKDLHIDSRAAKGKRPVVKISSSSFSEDN